MPPHSRPLSVLHVVDSLEPGGLERVVTDLACAQRRHGHHVVVFSIKQTEGFRVELEAAGIPVVIGDKQRPFDLRVLRRLRAAAAQQQTDVVHAHNFMPNYYSAAALLGMRHAPVLVGSCHDMGTRLENRKLRWIYGWALRRTQRVAMVGQQVLDRYMASGLVSADRAQKVLNGIPVDRFAPSAERRMQARQRLGLPPHALVIGCVGRLVALKNHASLIQAMPELIRCHPDLQVVIVGYGPEHNALQRLAQTLGVGEHLHITGQRQDVADLLPGFDIFALPSRTEGLSIALLEACASGLPVVATRVGGNPEIIHHESTGLLVPSDDIPALTEALMRLLDSEEARRVLGAAARTWVSEHASIDATYLAHDCLYRQALEEAAR